jgi:peroxiredoxin
MRAVTLALIALMTCLWAGSRALAVEVFPREWFSGSEQQRAMHDELVGKPPPTLDLTDWLDGRAVTAKDLRHKIVIIHFWATWCGPCLASIPTNNEIWNEYRDRGVVVMGVCSSRSGQERMEEVARNRQIAYPVARDPRVASAEAWRVQYWPTYAVIDRQGMVRAVGVRRDKLRDAVEKLLAEPQPESPKDEPALVQAPDESIPAEWREGDDEHRKVLTELENGPLPPLKLSHWMNSQPIDLASLKGKVVLLHFWTNKPGTGLKGLALTRELARRYEREGLVIIGIYSGPDLAQFSELVERHKIEYPVATDDGGDTAAAFKVADFPDYHLIDRTGRLRLADCGDYYLQIAIRRLLRETIAEHAGSGATGDDTSPATDANR